MTLKAVISNFTESYDLTKDSPTSPVTPGPTNKKGDTKPEDISTSWVDKFSTSVARATLHDRVLHGVSEDQMYSRDVRSFALIMLEMMTWLRQRNIAAKKRALERLERQMTIDESSENEMHMYMDEVQSQPSPVPFVRHVESHTLKPRSKREQALMREQQQHINVACDSSPEEEGYACNTFPRRGRAAREQANSMQKNQTQTKSDLLRIIHKKQDSMCSSDSHDSGVSSQPSSKAVSIRSGSSGSGSDKSPRIGNKSISDNLGNVEFDATTEMWVESHAEEANGFRPCVMQHGMQSSSTNIPNSCEHNESSCDPAEEEEFSKDELGPLPRSSSSLSQFYVRKRSPRPHSCIGRTATLPNNLNKKEMKQEMDLYNARANVSATLRPKSCYNSSDMLDRQRPVTPLSHTLSLQRPGSAMPFLPGLIIPQRTATPPPDQQFATIRRKGSRKQSCTKVEFTTNQQQQEMNITTNPKHLRSFNGQAQFPVSNIQFISEPILQPREDTPMLVGQRWDSTGCPSGVEEQHLGYCQELQTLFPHQLCTDGVIVQQEVECGRAMAKWIEPLSKMDGYLPKQVCLIMFIN